MPSDADAVFSEFTLYANVPSTQQNKNGGTIVCKADDTTATLVGDLFHEILNLQSPPNPLPDADEVSTPQVPSPHSTLQRVAPAVHQVSQRQHLWGFPSGVHTCVFFSRDVTKGPAVPVTRLALCLGEGVRAGLVGQALETRHAAGLVGRCRY